jgi:tRNA G18 (ribose-2'-O)-methylase SpoU
MKTTFQELLNRFIAFVGVLCSPRRSFAFRMLEAQNAELKEKIKDLEVEIRQLQEYSRYATKQPLLSDAKPKEPKPKTPIKQQIMRRAEIEAKMQRKFKQRYERIQAAKRKATKNDDPQGYPNDYPMVVESESIS